jgi:hypothetical protein
LSWGAKETERRLQKGLKALSLLALTLQPTNQASAPWRNVEGDESDSKRYHPESNHWQKTKEAENQEDYPYERSQAPRQMGSAPIDCSAQDANEIRSNYAHRKNVASQAADRRSRANGPWRIDALSIRLTEDWLATE